MTDNYELKDGGVKYDSQKLRWDLLPWDAIKEVVYVYTFGATKYEDRNWEKGMRWGRMFGASMRHIISWVGGETIDSESGCHHLAQAIFGWFGLIHFQMKPELRFNDLPDCEGPLSRKFQRELWKDRHAFLDYVAAGKESNLELLTFEKFVKSRSKLLAVVPDNLRCCMINFGRRCLNQIRGSDKMFCNHCFDKMDDGE